MRKSIIAVVTLSAAHGSSSATGASRRVRNRNHSASESRPTDHAVLATGGATRRGRQANDRHAEKQQDSAGPGLRSDFVGPQCARFDRSGRTGALVFAGEPRFVCSRLDSPDTATRAQATSRSIEAGLKRPWTQRSEPCAPPDCKASNFRASRRFSIRCDRWLNRPTGGWKPSR